MALEFRVTTGSNSPIYRQITEQIRKAIATGALLPGEQLPSVRALAEILVINPNTVAKAYADLTHDGVLESQAGKGLFVAQRRQKYTRAERKRRLEIALDAFVHEVLFLDFSSEEIMEQLRQKLAEIEGEVALKK